MEWDECIRHIVRGTEGVVDAGRVRKSRTLALRAYSPIGRLLPTSAALSTNERRSPSHTHTYPNTRTRAYTLISLCLLIYLHIRLCVLVYLHIPLCVLIYLHICLCVLMYLHIRLCVLMFGSIEGTHWRTCLSFYLLLPLSQIFISSPTANSGRTSRSACDRPAF